MRKKTENMDIIVDKKTVRITTAVFVTVMTMLAAIAAMFFTTMSVLAADAGSSSNSQSTISTTVPDSHNIRVEKSHADVVIEGEEDQIEGNIDNFVVDRFAEPKIRITPERRMEGFKDSSERRRRYGTVPGRISDTGRSLRGYDTGH